jgi:hypothetical protein
MSVLHTYQGSYEVLADFSSDVSLFDGSSAGATYDWNDRPNLIDGSQGCKRLGGETNGVEMIFLNDEVAEDGTNASFKLWGYTENGYAEYLADISLTTGTARFGDSTVVLWADTITIAEQVHIKNFTAKDNAGNNRIAKLQFDAAGYKYLCAELYDISSGWRIYYRGY